MFIYFHIIPLAARFKNKNHRRQPQQEYRNTHVVRTTFEDILDKRYPADKKKPIIKEFPSVSTALQWVVGGADDLPDLLMSMAPKSVDHFDGGSHIQVLVTGCVPIVGGIIKIFDPSSVLEYKNGV